MPIKNFIFLVGFCFLFGLNNAHSEVIELQNEEKTFGDWKVFCETDVMMDISHCKIAAKFYDNASVINIEPTTKFLSQLFVIIPKIKTGSFVKIRVDKNDLILSPNLTSRDFGLIPLSEEQKNLLYSQMKNGEVLFLRFMVEGQGNQEPGKEITVKLSLRNFKEALSYHNGRINGRIHNNS